MRFLLVGLVSVFFNLAAQAQLSSAPQCLDDDRRTVVAQDNRQVLAWKRDTADQYKDRAHVSGVVTHVYQGKASHAHFAIDLDGDFLGDLEVIYNVSFGDLPAIQKGMLVVACGDYITVGPRARLPSPMGAIIHWVHYNPGTRDNGKHPHGYLIINGRLYGFEGG